jgi:hypothetical protein
MNKFLFLFSVLLLVGACAPDRNNPLDPGNPDYEEVTYISITVRDETSAQSPVADVIVDPQEISGIYLTGIDGKVRIPYEKDDKYTFDFAKTGFFGNEDTLNTSIQGTSLATTLNHIPSLDTLILQTENNISLASLIASVDVNNPEGIDEITRVTISCPTLSFMDTLTYAGGRRFQRAFPLQSISGQLLPANVSAYVFEVAVRDGDYSPITLGRRQMSRVVQVTTTLERPGPAISETGNIHFRWEEFTLPYNAFAYIQIWRFETQLVLFYTIGPIELGNSEYILANADVLDQLETETLVWNLRVVDQFNNTWISGPSVFQYIK